MTVDRPLVPRHLRDRLVRATLFALCVLLSAQTLAVVSRWRTNRDRLSEILLRIPPSAETGRSRLAEGASESGESEDSLDVAAAIRRVAFERTPHHAKLTVARILVYEALAFGESAQASSSTAPVTRLPVARELALEVLSQQPNSWQASMFLGAATYLEWSLRSDRRLYTAAAEWERPLLEAMEQAAGKPEPRRFLAAAYLETWAALSAAKQASALELVTTMFREDPGSFRRLGPVWLEVAGDHPSALEVIPDLPDPWRVLEQSYAGKRDWDAFCLAHSRYVEALKRRLSRELDEAEQRLRLGDVTGGRQKSLAVVAGSPRDGLFADLVSRALELYPPGLRGLRRKESLNAWLSWALELHEIGIETFSPRAIGRLTDAVGELDASTAALAAVIAGDTFRINRYEKLAHSQRSKEWAPFLIAKSRWLTDRGDPDAASTALKDVHRSARSSRSYWLARRQLARATGDLSDLATADDRLAELRSTRWRASDWRWRGRRVILELYPQVESAGLELTISAAPARGAVAELLWDGSSIALEPVASGQILELAMEIEPRPHLLELRSLAGGEIQPGSVRLLLEE